MLNYFRITTKDILVCLYIIYILITDTGCFSATPSKIIYCRLLHPTQPCPPPAQQSLMPPPTPSTYLLPHAISASVILMPATVSMLGTPITT